MTSQILPIADGFIDLSKRIVQRGSRVEDLTSTEAALLEYLSERPGQLVTQRELLEHVWGYHPSTLSRAPTYTMRRIRGKVELDPGRPQQLLTDHGEGFRYVPWEAKPVEIAIRKPITRRKFALNAFVGREQETRALRRALSHPLTVVTGAPGVGKSRLVLNTLHDFDTPCVIFDLTALANWAAWLAQWSQATQTGVPDLVFLDGVDRFAGPMREWLATQIYATETTWVVSSTYRLGMPEERLIELGPLSPTDAKELFIRRVEEQGVVVTDTRSLNELVNYLDYFPLAVELAASRARFLTPAQILQTIRAGNHPSQTLTDASPRHASMQSAVLWARELLSPAAIHVFRMLSLFSGGATPEMLEKALGHTVLNELDELFEHHFVHTLPNRRIAVPRVLAASAFVDATDSEAGYRTRLQNWALGWTSVRLDPVLGFRFEGVSEELSNLIAALRPASPASAKIATTIGRWMERSQHPYTGACLLSHAIAHADPEDVPRLRVWRLALLAYPQHVRMEPDSLEFNVSEVPPPITEEIAWFLGVEPTLPESDQCWGHLALVRFAVESDSVQIDPDLHLARAAEIADHIGEQRAQYAVAVRRVMKQDALGNVREAVEQARVAQKVADGMGSMPHQVLARCMLAEALWAGGEPDEPMQLLNDAWSIERTFMRSVDADMPARGASRLVELYCEREEWSEATAIIQSAHQLGIALTQRASIRYRLMTGNEEWMTSVSELGRISGPRERHNTALAEAARLRSAGDYDGSVQVLLRHLNAMPSGVRRIAEVVRAELMLSYALMGQVEFARTEALRIQMGLASPPPEGWMLMVRSLDPRDTSQMPKKPLVPGFFFSCTNRQALRMLHDRRVSRPKAHEAMQFEQQL